MSTAYIVIALVTIAVNAGIAIADAMRADFVLANAAEVHVPAVWLPRLAILKGLGALGVLVGFWIPAVGIAAAAGLTLFFVGAVAAHVRAGVFYNVAFPGIFLALAVATLTLTIATQ